MKSDTTIISELCDALGRDIAPSLVKRGFAGDTVNGYLAVVGEAHPLAPNNGHATYEIVSEQDLFGATDGLSDYAARPGHNSLRGLS